MYRVWLGKLPIRTAIRDGRIALHGQPAIVRRLPAALELSQIADVVASVG